MKIIKYTLYKVLQNGFHKPVHTFLNPRDPYLSEYIRSCQYYRISWKIMSSEGKVICEETFTPKNSK